MSHPITRIADRDRYAKRQILAREIDNRVILRAHRIWNRELKRHVLGLRLRHHGQWPKCRQIHARQWSRAGIRDDEVLDGCEGEAGGSTRQEGGCGWCLLLREAVETILFAFLCDDGAEDGDEAALVAGVGGESSLCFGEGAEDDVGECVGEGHGFEEGGDGELVLAGLDLGLACVPEDAVHACCVELFLLESFVSFFFVQLGERVGLHSQLQ